MDDFNSHLMACGINPRHLAKFLKSSIRFSRLIQSLHIGQRQTWLKREMELTEAEKLLIEIRKNQ